MKVEEEAAESGAGGAPTGTAVLPASPLDPRTPSGGLGTSGTKSRGPLSRFPSRLSVCRQPPESSTWVRHQKLCCVISWVRRIMLHLGNINSNA